MASVEFSRTRLSVAERDAFIAELADAAALLGSSRPPTLLARNDDGTWDVGCTLEGETHLIKRMFAAHCLNLSLT